MQPRLSNRSLAWPLLALVLATVALISSGYAIWCHLQLKAIDAARAEEVEPTEDRRVLRAAAFDELPGWSRDNLAEALPALRRTCDLFLQRPADAPLPPTEIGGTVADWSAACHELTAATDSDALRQVLESRFTPLQVLNNGKEIGLFTGYYEPSMSGSRTRRAAGQVPLYRKPTDLVTVDLEPFHDRFAGSRISGRVAEGTFKPYYERLDISTGALAERDLELAWVDDPVDAFFLHIQGSGRIELAEGGEMRVGYAGQNGRPYYAIGRELVDRGALSLEEVSMQSIRQWLEDNPAAAQDVMATNPSYVFFHQLEGEGPVGTQGVALTPRRSLAVDRAFLPLGVPVWLDALAPTASGDADQPIQRLLVTQDTGGAIKGPVRGDIFWGHGKEAEAIAGRMKHEGRLWILLPNALAQRALSAPM